MIDRDLYGRSYYDFLRYTASFYHPKFYATVHELNTGPKRSDKGLRFTRYVFTVNRETYENWHFMLSPSDRKKYMVNHKPRCSKA